jgi:hypothetical protein
LNREKAIKKYYVLLSITFVLAAAYFAFVHSRLQPPGFPLLDAELRKRLEQINPAVVVAMWKDLRSDPEQLSLDPDALMRKIQIVRERGRGVVVGGTTAVVLRRKGSEMQEGLTFYWPNSVHIGNLLIDCEPTAFHELLRQAPKTKAWLELHVPHLFEK